MLPLNDTAWESYVNQQPITFIGWNGSTIQTSLTHLNALHYNKVFEALSQGFAIGFPSMLLIVLFLVTDSSKYRRPGFILNAICLFLVCFENIFVKVRGIQSRNVASRIILEKIQCIRYPEVILVVQAILYPCIFASLILQVRIVFVDWPRARFIITVILALLTAGLEGGYIAYRLIMCGQPVAASTSIVYRPSKVAFDISFTCFVCICCALLFFKLCFTIKMSRGFRGFLIYRPLQVLLITILLCLVVPGNSPSISNLLHLTASCLTCHTTHERYEPHLCFGPFNRVAITDGLAVSFARCVGNRDHACYYITRNRKVSTYGNHEALSRFTKL
jgi:Fungal pheromone mating factor STE2 GPCR